MIAFLVMIPALLFMAGILAVAVTFAEKDDHSAVQAELLRTERSR